MTMIALLDEVSMVSDRLSMEHFFAHQNWSCSMRFFVQLLVVGARARARVDLNRN